MTTPGFNNPSYLVGQFGTPNWGVSGQGVKPFTGNYFWVDETNGSDGNTGGPSDAFKTLTQALTKCTANNNDVVFVTGTIHVSATVTWNKSRTHLIGLCPDAQSNARARISQTGSTVFSPLVNVTAAECIIANIGAFHGFADASSQICWTDSGGRNSYKGCAFLGMANATAAAQAGGRSLVISTAGESLFENCQIGLDTITRNAANASLEFTGGTPRNTFRNCIFPMMTTSAGALFIVTAAASAIDRWQWFQDCAFINCSGSGSTAITVAASMAASAGGLLMMQRCTLLGGNASTNWGDTAALAQMWVDGGAPTAATTGLAVNPS